MRGIPIAASAALFALSLSGCGGAADASSSTPTTPTIQSMVADCHLHQDDYGPTDGVKYGDGGRSMTISYLGILASNWITSKDVTCATSALGMPDSTMARIKATRDIDGMQSDTWGSYKATWTNGEKNGLKLILEEKR